MSQECEAIWSPDVLDRWGHSIRHSTSACQVLVFCKGSLEHYTNTASISSGTEPGNSGEGGAGNHNLQILTNAEELHGFRLERVIMFGWNRIQLLKLIQQIRTCLYIPQSYLQSDYAGAVSHSWQFISADISISENPVALMEPWPCTRELKSSSRIDILALLLWIPKPAVMTTRNSRRMSSSWFCAGLRTLLK